MIETLLPTAVCCEMFSDTTESQMFSSEAALVADAVAERRREFGTVRHCARRALRKIGVAAIPILPDADGAPRWPADVVGSMTHCKGYRAAAIARSPAPLGIGIDAETDTALHPAVADLVLRDEERVHLRKLTETDPHRHWATILFCAKEAAFKAWFPTKRKWLDFRDVSVNVQPSGTFLASVYASPATSIGWVFAGRWKIGHGIIVAATSVSQFQETRDAQRAHLFHDRFGPA